MERVVSESNCTGIIQPVEGLPDNYIIKDQFGNNHEMVELPLFKWDAIKGFDSENIHPAFIANGCLRRIFIGKYQASVKGGKYVTEKSGLVAHSLNYDNSNKICNELNDDIFIKGFHLMTNAEWAAVSMVSHKILNGARVQGNNKCGRDFSSDKILGIPEPGHENSFKNYDFPARWLAGSGGISTSHNGNESGIYDLNGNVWEWVKGLRLNDGEINIIADAALSTINDSDDSLEWKAILEDGSLVKPGNKGTLKFNGKGEISKRTMPQWDGHTFKSTSCVKSVSPDCPGVELLKKLSVFPHTTDLHEDYFWYDTNGIRLPLRGGYWNHGAGAGLFRLLLGSGRGDYGVAVGFRVAFVL